MNVKLEKPIIIRTTLKEALETECLPYSGIYILAYMNQILYVGKSSVSINDRLKSHLEPNSRTGVYLRRIEFDWDNIRLDILEPPKCDNHDCWLMQAEMSLINQFKPLFNVQYV